MARRAVSSVLSEVACVGPGWTPAVDGVPARRIALGSSLSLAFPRRAVSSQLKLPFLQFRPSGNVEDHYRSRGIRHTARYLRAGGPLRSH